MFQTMTQIGKEYNIDAKAVGKLLYTLKIRDPNHAQQKGFPFEQAITHGIAKGYEGRGGENYYRYDIEAVKAEFEKLVHALPEPTSAKATEAKPPVEAATIEQKLQHMLAALNKVLETGETDRLYELKADIADIYSLLPQKAS